MTKTSRLLPSFLALAIALTACSGSGSRVKKGKTVEGEVVEAEGTAPYREDDLPGTKAAALAAAQRSAVELVVGVYVSAKTRVDKAVAIENNILTNTSGFVKRYEILKEERSDEWYKMRIRALVATKDVRRELDQLGLMRQPALGYPRLAIVLQEYVAEKENKSGYATRALAQTLISQGYKVVELPKSVNQDEDPLELAKTVNRNAAEILVAGLGRAQSLGYGKEFGGMHSVRASVSFRVIETGSSEVVATVSQTASGLEATQDLAAQKALEKAAQMAGAELKTLPQELTKRAHVDLTITGITSFETLGSLQKSLAGERGVKDVYLRSFNQEEARAVLDVLVDQLSAQEVADRTARIGGSYWTVYQVTGRSAQISATQAGR